MPNVYIETYGCANSQAESEIIAGLIKKAGFTIVEDYTKTDLAIVVTCYVKAPTEQKILFRLEELGKKKLIVAGCMPEGVYGKLVKVVPNASLVSTHHVRDIVQAVEKTLQGRRVEYLGKSEEVKLCLPKIRRNSVISIVPISSGCNSKCTYCCVNIAKGKLFSYPKDMILEEVETSVKEGCKEVWLTAQDTAAYGYDREEKLPSLLESISEIPGEFLVRVGMMNLKNVMPMASELVKTFSSEKIYKFVHLPIQSGSDKVLSDMNRGYSASQFEETVKMLRKSNNFQFWTDVIVGYPTETEEDFQETVNVIERLRLDWTNVSKFGARTGTAAAKLKPLPIKTVNERSRVLSGIVRKISLEKNMEWVCKSGKVLISEKGRGNSWIGRNIAYKKVIIDSRDNLLGNLLDVKFVDSDQTCLKGERL